MGFPANYSLNAFKILGNSMQVGGTGGAYNMDTVLRLDSAGSSVPYMSASKGIKRKWSSIATLKRGPFANFSMDSQRNFLQ